MWSECSCVMRTASMSSGDSPISARRRVSSFTLNPASIRIRVFDVARKAALLALPLASTQNLTMTFLLSYVLTVFRSDCYAGSGHLGFDDVDEFLHSRRALMEFRGL